MNGINGRPEPTSSGVFCLKKNLHSCVKSSSTHLQIVNDASSKLNSNSSSPLKLKPTHSLVFSFWFKYLRIARLIGNWPLSIHGETGRVSFNWKSRISLYSCLIGLLRIVTFIIYYKDWGYFVLGREYENTIEDWILLSMNVIIPTFQCWDVIATWLVAQRSAILWNSWIDMELRFEEVFTTKYIYSTHAEIWHRIYILLSAIPTLTTMVVVLLELCLVNPIPEHGNYQRWLLITIRAIPSTFFCLITVVEDTKCLLMLFASTEGLVNLTNGIRSHLKDQEHVDHRLVSKWTKVLQLVRKNVKLTGNIEAPKQIFVFLQSVIIFTELLFMTIQVFIVGSYTRHFVITALIGISYWQRIGVKILMADNVTQKEQKIAELLLGTDADIFDIHGKLEVKKIIDVIQQKPSKISLNGYLVLEKRMIPKIVSCVVSYLVILVQFQLTYKFSYESKRS